MAHFSSYNTGDNSGATPLTANASMTPIIMQTGTAANLTGTIMSDQSGTLTIGQSFDGGTDYDGATVINVAAGVGQTFSVPVIAPMLRISYTNGATNQTYMRLYARAFGTRGG